MLTIILIRRYPAVTITDLRYEDYIAIITNKIKQAHEFLTSIEIETEKIGIKLNSNTTEVIVIPFQFQYTRNNTIQL